MQDTIGIDISKDTLDAHRQTDGRHARFGNDRAGLMALRRWIGKAPVRVVYEATGRYHRDMEGALDAAGYALVKVNPGRARRFAQAAGYGAKTDRVDAAMLARMGMALDLDATPVRSESMHEIKELHVARLGLIKDRTACRNRLQAARNKVVLAQLRARLRQVEGQIEQIDTELHRLVMADPALAHRFGILLSIPGIGPVAGIAMIVEMPELGALDGKEAASLAGLAPITRELGKMEGPVTDRRRTTRIASGALHARSGDDPPQHRTRPGLPDALRRRKTRESRDHRRDAKAPAPRKRIDPG